MTTEDAPRLPAGVQTQPGSRHELCVYVRDVDSTVDELRGAGATIVRAPADMLWGERIAYVTDPRATWSRWRWPPAG